MNYAFVILGNDIGYDKKTGKIIVRPECYFDKNGKRTASYEELLECFQWSDENNDIVAVKEELADVIVYCRNMLDKLELDEDEIVNAKMEQNEKKYPVEKAKGKVDRYNKLK